MEIWKDIEGYEGLYQVSDKGNVRSVDRTVVHNDGKVRHLKGKELIATDNGNDYLYVSLYKNGKGHKKKIHRLVAEAFIENPDNKPFIDHIDGNRYNNVASNIRYCTSKENNSFELYRSHQKNNKLKSKKVFQYTLDGELVAVYPSTMEAQRNGFDNGHISACCLGKYKQHKGYRWSYVPL